MSQSQPAIPLGLQLLVILAYILQQSQMRSERGRSVTEHDKLQQKIRQRLTLQNIHREIELIPSMNKHLQIPIQAAMKLNLFSGMPKEEVISIMQRVSFIKYHKKSELSHKQCFKIQYENANRMLLVTGIQLPFIENILSYFNNYYRKLAESQKTRSTYARVSLNTPFWVGIEAISEDVASALKKTLRNQKRNMDENNKKLEYKIEHRRIRIIIVKEDLFTLLVDAMTEHKAQLFQRRLQLVPAPLDPNKPQEYIIYRPIVFNNVQNNAYRTDNRQQEFSDGFSESNSLNSDLFDPNKMKDIIETSDQGIQSQNNNSTPLVPIQDTYSGKIDQSPSKSAKQLKSTDQLRLQQKKEAEHEKQVVLKSQILRSNDQEFGLGQGDQQQRFLSPKKLKALASEDICTEKISPIYSKHEINNQQLVLRTTKISMAHEAAAQTQEPLYNVIPDHLMRKCLQQFKGRSHSQLVELPEWLKSESENERNRHRFFSSLCKPKLIHRQQPF